MDRALDDVSLIETMRFEPEGGFVRLRLHLARLSRSARRLGFPPPHDIGSTLAEAVNGTTGPRRVRLTYNRNGRIDVTTAAFTPLPSDAIWRIRIARTRLDSSNRLLRLKTTRRAVYEAARAEYSMAEADEVLLLNERDEVCEGTITSIFVDDGSGILKTPPISAGLLAGVLRTELICARKARIARLTIKDLEPNTLVVGNSLRGLIRARLDAS